MDILIKGMKMPKGGTLTLVVHPNGDVYLGDVLKDIKIGKAIELPPHGRLGDLDALEKKVIEKADFPSYEWCTAIEQIRNAPIVLERTT